MTPLETKIAELLEDEYGDDRIGAPIIEALARLCAPSLDEANVERVAQAIYDAPDSQSGDTVGTVIFNSTHLFCSTDGEEIMDIARRATMPVCRDAARAAITAMREGRD